MWNNLEMQADYLREQRRQQLAVAEHDRLILSCGRPLALSRRAARPLGRALFTIAGWLLRYGKEEQVAAMQAYRPSVRSVETN